MSKMGDRIKEIVDKLEKTKQTSAALEKSKAAITGASKIAEAVKRFKNQPSASK